MLSICRHFCLIVFSLMPRILPGHIYISDACWGSNWMNCPPASLLCFILSRHACMVYIQGNGCFLWFLSFITNLSRFNSYTVWYSCSEYVIQFFRIFRILYSLPQLRIFSSPQEIAYNYLTQSPLITSNSLHRLSPLIHFISEYTHSGHFIKNTIVWERYLWLMVFATYLPSSTIL